MKTAIRTYECELDWVIDGGQKTVSCIVHYDYSQQRRGGRSEPDWLDSVTLIAVRVAKQIGQKVEWKDILPALPAEITEHLQLRVLEDIRANRNDYEYDQHLDRVIGL